MKKWAAILMTAVMLAAGCGYTPAKAKMADTGVASPCTVNIQTMGVYLNISSSGLATIDVAMSTRVASTINNSITVYLMKKSGSIWTGVGTWTKSSKSATLAFSTTKKLSSRGTYKVKVVANTQVGKSYEMYTLYSTQHTY